jgi:hypothetical protein
VVTEHRVGRCWAVLCNKAAWPPALGHHQRGQGLACEPSTVYAGNGPCFQHDVTWASGGAPMPASPLLKGPANAADGRFGQLSVRCAAILATAACARGYIHACTSILP